MRAAAGCVLRERAALVMIAGTSGRNPTCPPVCLPPLPPSRGRYTYTKKQRRCMVGTMVGLGVLLATLVALVALAAVRGGRGPSDSAWHTGDPIADSLASAEELELCSWAGFRLPRTVVPRQYNLTLEVAMEGDYGVQGSVGIDVDTLQVSGVCVCVCCVFAWVGGCAVGGWRGMDAGGVRGDGGVWR